MTLEQYFDKLAEVFVEKYPFTKNTIYFYILASVKADLDNIGFVLLFHNVLKSSVCKEIIEKINTDFFSSIFPILLSDYEFNLNEKPEFSDFFTDDGHWRESPLKDRYIRIYQYLISRCLEIEKNVETLSNEEFLSICKAADPNLVISPDKSRMVSGNWNFQELPDELFRKFSENHIAVQFKNQELYSNWTEAVNNVLALYADPKPNASIFVPDCGMGSIFTSIQERFPKHELQLNGSVDGDFLQLLTNTNMALNQTDAYVEDLESPPDNDFAHIDTVKYDLVLAIAPRDTRIVGKFRSRNLELTKDHKSYEVAYFEAIYNLLNDTGRALVIVPKSFLFKHQSKGFRKFFVEDDLVELVVSLPDIKFDTGRANESALVIINKSKLDKNHIRFQTGIQDDEVRVNINEISSKIDLRPFRYASKQAREFGKLRTRILNDEKVIAKVRTLVEKHHSGTNPKNKVPSEPASECMLPFVRVSDLAKDESVSDLDVSSIERRIDSELIAKKSVIDFSALLLNKIAPNLNGTYFHFESEPIAIGSDVLALKLKDTVDPNYLISQLHSEFVRLQIELARSGATIPRVTVDDLLDLQVMLPSLEVQKSLAIESLKVRQRDLIKEVGEKEKDVRSTEYDVIAAISHNLNQKLGNIVDDYDTLIRHIKRREREDGKVTFQDLLRPLQKGESVDDADTLKKLTSRLQNNLNDTVKTFRTTERILQKNTINGESTNIVAFFKNEISTKLKGGNFSIMIQSKPSKLMVNLDRDAFRDAVRNLIDNARNHGFTGEEGTFKIVFDIQKYLDQNGVEFARIIYKNNGKAFPKGFSFEEYKRFGSRAGKTKKSGIGGFFVNKVIRLHSGVFNHYSDEESQHDEYPVQFEIRLPLEDKPNK